jgi:hypothetical protein
MRIISIGSNAFDCFLPRRGPSQLRPAETGMRCNYFCSNCYLLGLTPLDWVERQESGSELI